jgi:hypothetical protein
MDDPRDKLIRQLQETVCQQQEVILRQQAVIEELGAKVAQLERQIGQAEPGKGKLRGMPGNKLEAAKPPPEKAPRKKRECNYTRVRGVPTHRVEHAVDECTGCGTRLTHGSVKRTREVIEVPLVPATVTEHVFVERRCFNCGKRCVPKDVLGDVAVGKSRLGIGLQSLISALREVGRLPIATIQWYLDTFHRLSLSPGAIVGVLRSVAHRAEGVVKQIHQSVRESPWVCADETGWREDGRNGFVWTFSTPELRLFVRAGRDKGVVEKVLEGFGGTLVSDYYAAYNVYMGFHQRCWPHLLRDIHELRELYPGDEGLQRWAREVHDLYGRAKLYAGLESQDEHQRLNTRLYFEGQLLEVCKPYLGEKQAVQHVLAKRIERHIKELFVFVSESGVPSDNNGAERSLRHLVMARKISGGTRSPAGTKTKMALASMFGTWEAQGLNPFTQCLQLLKSPQP